MVKNLPANAGDMSSIKEEMATHSSILAWRIPWTEQPERATLHGVTKSWIRLNPLSTYLSVGSHL